MNNKAQNKALNLFSTYRALLSLPGAPLGDQKDEVAQQCALHTANELYDETGDEFWQEVIKKIEEL